MSDYCNWISGSLTDIYSSSGTKEVR